MRRWFVVDWEECLGGGSEGEVFLGRCVETRELCAIKVSTLLDPEEARAQLSREFARLTQAKGEGVVGLVGWNLDAPRPFLVFELAHAGTLADEMRELREAGRTYHPVRALQRIRAVLASLANVHDRGLVHRDIKPTNLLRFDQSIKLADFGTGRSLDRPTALQTQAFVGTRMYAAPEQINGEPVDERVDLYAVGCILHEMLHGTVPRPFEARVFIDHYPNPLVLPELDRLVRSLLAENRSQRPCSASEALRKVDAALATYEAARRVWERLRLGPSPY